MSPLVAGTRPARSGREALGPGPSRRHDPPIVTAIYRCGRRLTCPLVQATGVARPSRERSRLIPPSASTSRPPAFPHELQRLAASRCVRPLGPAQPSIRADRIPDRSPLTASVDRRLEARTGKASPSDPRPPRGEPGTVVGRPLQPCPLVIHSGEQLEPPPSERSLWPTSVRLTTRSAARRPHPGTSSSRTPPPPPAPRRSPRISTTPPA